MSLRTRLIAAAVIAAGAIVALSPGAWAATPHAAGGKGCCRVPAGTAVQVELVHELSSATQKTGDSFPLRLAAPLIVNGMVVLPRGARGEGEVIESDGPGIGGKPAKMVLAAKYLSAGGRRVPLDALQLSRPGRDKSRTSQLVGLSGMVFAPLRFVGIAVPGGQVSFQPGTVATAEVSAAVTLPPLRRATRADLAAASAAVPAAPEVEGPIAVGPPPPGQGQVVFFRRKSLMGVGQWFNVRENGKALGKLTNGAYFVEVTPPGVHTYTAKLEPELKDHLTLKVDPGETYFVEGALTGGLVLGAADLAPSSRGSFEKAAKDLHPAGAPGNGSGNGEEPGQASASAANAATPAP